MLGHRVGQRRFEDREALLDDGVGGGQRHHDAQRVAVHAAAQQDQAALQRMGDHRLGEGRVFFRGVEILHELDRQHRAQPADVPHPVGRGACADLGKSGAEVRAHGGGAGQQAFAVDGLDRCKRRGTGHGVAAIGAAQAAGGHGVHDLGPADDTGDGIAAGHGFRHGDEVRHHARMLDGEPGAGAAEARLDFIGDEQDAVLVADRAQRLPHLGRDGNVAAFAQHRFEDDRGDAARVRIGQEQRLETLDRVLDRDAVARIGEGGSEDVGGEGTHVLLVGADLAGHAQRQQGAAVIAAGEGDDAGTAGGGAGDLDRVLDGFGAGGDQQGLFRMIAGGQRVQLFRQRHVGLVGHDLERGVRIEVFLRLGGGHDRRVTVAGVEHGDAAGEVDVAVALDIPELGILGAGGKDRRGRGDATRHGGFAAGEQGGVGLAGHGAGDAAAGGDDVIGTGRGRGLGRGRFGGAGFGSGPGRRGFLGFALRGHGHPPVGLAVCTHCVRDENSLLPFNIVVNVFHAKHRHSFAASSLVIPTKL